jgi:hypothetical protein
MDVQTEIGQVVNMFSGHDFGFSIGGRNGEFMGLIFSLEFEANVLCALLRLFVSGFEGRFGGSCPDGPNLDRAPSRHWTTCGPFKRLVQVGNIDHDDTTDQFLTLGKGTVLYVAFAISYPDRGCGLRRL